jgi:1,6-anhydro-N-acetylmuramate kinase
LIVVGAGIALDVPDLIRAGAAAGAVGAAAYAWFAVTIFFRTQTHLSAPTAEGKGKAP